MRIHIRIETFDLTQQSRITVQEMGHRGVHRGLDTRRQVHQAFGGTLVRLWAEALEVWILSQVPNVGYIAVGLNAPIGSLLLKPWLESPGDG